MGSIWSKADPKEQAMSMLSQALIIQAIEVSTADLETEKTVMTRNWVAWCFLPLLSMETKLHATGRKW